MNPTMPTIDIDGVKISSSLFVSPNPQYLSQDQLTVALPNGYYIAVGWHPEHDPAGAYVIHVFYQYADNSCVSPIVVRDMMDMLSTVTSLAYRWSGSQVSTASSESVG